jgi:hypothetical protein
MFAAARAAAKAEFAYAKRVRRSLPVLSANRSCRAQRAPPRGSIDAKIILWLKYFSRWDGVTLQRAFAMTGLCVSSPCMTAFRL